MIFLTLGTQLPFDRLVRAVDVWCSKEDRSDVFGQIPEPGPKGYKPQSFEWTTFLEPNEYRRRFESADLIVAHAGMGSIITALSLVKPIIIMPRRADFGEQRNDHQLATVERFRERNGIHVVVEENEVAPALDRLMGGSQSAQAEAISPFADEGIVSAVRAAIFEPRASRETKASKLPQSDTLLADGNTPSGRQKS